MCALILKAVTVFQVFFIVSVVVGLGRNVNYSHTTVDRVHTQVQYRRGHYFYSTVTSDSFLKSINPAYGLRELTSGHAFTLEK